MNPHLRSSRRAVRQHIFQVVDSTKLLLSRCLLFLLLFSIFLVCVCVFVVCGWEHIHATVHYGKRTAFSTGFSPSTVDSQGQTQIIRLMWKHSFTRAINSGPLRVLHFHKTVWEILTYIMIGIFSNLRFYNSSNLGIWLFNIRIIGFFLLLSRFVF